MRRRDVARLARLTAISGAAKGPGFLIPIVVAAFFGMGSATDAYFLAYAGFLLAGGTVGPALEATIVPFAAGALVRGREPARTLVETLRGGARRWGAAAALLGAAALSVGLLVATPEGVSPARVLLFYLCLTPAVIAWCIGSVYGGSLSAAWRLEANAVGYAFRGIGALAGAVAGVVAGVLWPVALGVSAGECVRVLWLRRQWARALGAIPSTDAPPESSPADARSFGRSTRHMVGSQALLSAAPLVERLVAGALAAAAISRVELASRLVSVAAVLFDGAVGPWLLAHWSERRARSGLAGDRGAVLRPIALGSAAALIVAAVLAAAAEPLVGLAFSRGRFTADDAAVVTTLVRWYAAAFFFTMTALCAERLLLAQSRSAAFLSLSVVRLVIRLLAVATLVPRMGIVGLPAAGIVADAAYALLLVVSGARTRVPAAAAAA